MKIRLLALFICLILMAPNGWGQRTRRIDPRDQQSLTRLGKQATLHTRVIRGSAPGMNGLKRGPQLPRSSRRSRSERQEQPMSDSAFEEVALGIAKRTKIIGNVDVKKEGGKTNFYQKGSDTLLVSIEVKKTGRTRTADVTVHQQDKVKANIGSNYKGKEVERRMDMSQGSVTLKVTEASAKFKLAASMHSTKEGILGKNNQNAEAYAALSPGGPATINKVVNAAKGSLVSARVGGFKNQAVVLYNTYATKPSAGASQTITKADPTRGFQGPAKNQPVVQKTPQVIPAANRTTLSDLSPGLQGLVEFEFPMDKNPKGMNTPVGITVQSKPNKDTLPTTHSLSEFGAAKKGVKQQLAKVLNVSPDTISDKTRINAGLKIEQNSGKIHIALGNPKIVGETKENATFMIQPVSVTIKHDQRLDGTKVDQPKPVSSHLAGYNVTSIGRVPNGKGNVLVKAGAENGDASKTTRIVVDFQSIHGTSIKTAELPNGSIKSYLQDKGIKSFKFTAVKNGDKFVGINIVIPHQMVGREFNFYNRKRVQMKDLPKNSAFSRLLPTTPDARIGFKVAPTKFIKTTLGQIPGRKMKSKLAGYYLAQKGTKAQDSTPITLQIGTDMELNRDRNGPIHIDLYDFAF